MVITLHGLGEMRSARHGARRIYTTGELMTLPPYGPIPMSNDLCGNNDGITIPSLYGVVEVVASQEQVAELEREIRKLERVVEKLTRQLRKQRYRKVD